MALESENSGKADNDEDDLGCYFLQPASSPYNIAEKVHQANFDLFNSTPELTRSIKVKFRDELVSFEPDLTDDDVNSIESDHVEEDLVIQEEVETIKETSNTYSTVLRENISLDDTEDDVGEVFEEEVLSSDTDEVADERKCKGGDEIIDSKIVTEAKYEKETEAYQKMKQRYKRRKLLRKTDVNCKDHCIEKVTSHLSMSIKKLELHEKPLINLPPLQLHQRSCCDDSKSSSSSQNLPNYNGYRSEYGLSYRQLKHKHKHIEMIRQKEMARQKLIEEYRILKIQQNENVFCQWLKQVSKRDKEKREMKKEHQLRLKSGSFQIHQQLCLSPNVVNINKNAVKHERGKERPKTAGFNEFVPKTTVKKKRPNTTQSCVYIEVPQNVLKKGIYIGDLLVTNSKEISKKLHILTAAQ